MSKYVKIDDIMQYPIRKNHYDRENGDENFIFGIESVMEYIEQLPTVELIRCRDCKHYYVINEVRGNCSEYNFVEKIPIDYCSWAERKEE